MTWSEILSQAVIEKEHRGVADPDQAYILGELIRYLEHPKSGAMEFDDMGQSWVAVRNAVADGTLRANNPGAAEVAGRFDALLRYTALQLGTRLGTEATVAFTRKELVEPGARIAGQVADLVDHGRLTGSIRIPNTIGPIDIVVDLRAHQVVCSVSVDAPKEGRPLTRVNWLVRQLRQANDKVRLECNVINQRGSGATELLGKVREHPEVLVLDPTKVIRSFAVAVHSPMALKSGRGQGGFIDGFLGSVDAFYAEVLQVLKAWSAKPPRMREPVDQVDLAHQPDAAPALESTAHSSQDGPEPVERADQQPTAEAAPTPQGDSTLPLRQGLFNGSVPRI